MATTAFGAARAVMASTSSANTNQLRALARRSGVLAAGEARLVAAAAPRGWRHGVKQFTQAPPLRAVAASALEGSDRALSEEEKDELLQDVTRKLMDCRRCKAASNAVDLLVGLGQEGVEPDLMASTACLGACVAANNMELAQKVFEEVFEKGVVDPDEVALSVSEWCLCCSMLFPFLT